MCVCYNIATVCAPAQHVFASVKSKCATLEMYTLLLHKPLHCMLIFTIAYRMGVLEDMRGGRVDAAHSSLTEQTRPAIYSYVREREV